MGSHKEQQHQQFLRQRQQQQPLLLKGWFKNFCSPITPEELGGLALEEEVDSSLLLQTGSDWQQWQGPLEEHQLTSLPPQGWSLQVDGLQLLVPEVARLLDQVQLLPNWTLNDLQGWFTPQGTQLPSHVVEMETLILQGCGTQQWTLEASPESHQPPESWLLSPGDLLYIPAGCRLGCHAHSDALSYLLRYRPPSTTEMVADLLGRQLATIEQRPTPDLTLIPPSGAIPPQTLESIQQLVRSLILDDEALTHWYGGYISTPPWGAPTPPAALLSSAQLTQQLQQQGELWRSEYSSCHTAATPSGHYLYCGPDHFLLSDSTAPLATLLCQQRRYGLLELTPYLQGGDALTLLTGLYNLGALYLPE